jgi:hypothetical protein
VTRAAGLATSHRQGAGDTVLRRQRSTMESQLLLGDLGEIENAIAGRAGSLEGQGLPGEGFTTKYARLNTARVQAGSKVLRQMPAAAGGGGPGGLTASGQLAGRSRAVRAARADRREPRRAAGTAGHPGNRPAGRRPVDYDVLDGGAVTGQPDPAGGRDGGR